MAAIRAGGRAGVLGVVALAATAFLLRALSVLQPSADEPLWLERSERYITAYLALDLPGASSSVQGSPTMPGITTSLVGGLAHLLWEGLGDLGLIDSAGQRWVDSRTGLAIAQLGMAAVNAVLIVLLVWVLWRWANATVAATAGVLLATEPYLVAHGIRLTTDSFVMLFAAIGAFALVATFGIAMDQPLGDRAARRMAAVAGLGIAGALLSKLSALAFGPFLLAVVVYAGVRARRDGELREVGRRLLVLTVAGLVLVIVLWPAIWADPGGQLDVLLGSAGLVDSATPIYWFGEFRADPGPLYYFVVTAIRMTPWFLALATAGLVAVIAARSTRRRALVALAYAAVPWIVISLSAKKYDRYAIMVWPALAVIAGLCVHLLVVRASRATSPRRARILVAGCASFVVVAAFLVVPHAAVYTSPLLGGSAVAQEVIGVSGTVAEAGTYIRDREGLEQCSRRRILSATPQRLYFPCGTRKRIADARLLERGDYVVVNAGLRRRSPDLVRAVRRHGRLVERIEQRGIDIADVYQLSEPLPAGALPLATATGSNPPGRSLPMSSSRASNDCSLVAGSDGSAAGSAGSPSSSTQLEHPA